MPSEKKTTRAAIYARYSSDLQNPASIEDQIRVCRAEVERRGGEVVAVYDDAAVSGASVLRPGYQNMLQEARDGRFDVVVAESLDRLSRDQEGIAALYKRMHFAGVAIVTLDDGEITDMHVGVEGTMNAMQLKVIADKTRRGPRGRVESGKSGGGKSYGYDVVKRITDNGELVRGDFVINEAQAAVVRRIFRDYASGLSPRAIAKALNAEGVPGPSGKGWGPGTIHGNRRRGTGILNNELYIGRRIGCANARNKGTCTNKRTMRRDALEAAVLEGLQHHLMDPALMEVFCEAYTHSTG